MITTLVHGNEFETLKEAPSLTITRTLGSKVRDMPRNSLCRLVDRGCYALFNGMLCRRDHSVDVVGECDLKLTSFLRCMFVY